MTRHRPIRPKFPPRAALSTWALGLLVGALAAPAAAADLPLWSTVDNGGGLAAGGGYGLVGTIGQPDAGLMVGREFTLRGGYAGGGFTATGVDDPDETPPVPVAVFRFHPVTPNPFNPVTKIAFDLPAPERVKLQVYDLRGQLVRVLAAQEMPSGRHEVVWRGDDDAGHTIASGVYLVTFEAGPHVVRRKITLVR